MIAEEYVTVRRTPFVFAKMQERAVNHNEKSFGYVRDNDMEIRIRCAALYVRTLRNCEGHCAVPSSMTR